MGCRPRTQFQPCSASHPQSVSPTQSGLYRCNQRSFCRCQPFQKFTEIFFNTLSISINDTLDSVVKQVNNFQPDFIMGYSSAVHLLAREQLEGNIAIKPRLITCSADPLTENIRTTIKAAFGVNPTNFYASSETVSMGIECPNKRSLHLFSDLHIFELLDENMKPVDNNKYGTLYLTNLYNFNQPLIRYKMSDQLCILNKQCDCGWPFPVVETIAGRDENFLWFKKKDGSMEYIHPLLLIEFFVPGLEKFQFIQTDPTTLTMKVIVNIGKVVAEKTIRQQMHSILSNKKLESFVTFDIEFVDKIDCDPKTGKFKTVIPFGRGVK